MNKKDWALLTLALVNGKELSPVQLQKAIFLFEKLLPSSVMPADFYEFVPYNYGPFCSAIYDDVMDLESEGFAKIIVPTTKSYREYTATPAGIAKGMQLRECLPIEIAAYAEILVNWVQQRTFTELVSAVYERYPEYRANSIFKG